MILISVESVGGGRCLIYKYIEIEKIFEKIYVVFRV